MAPIEIDYGHVVEHDNQDLLIHGDSLDSVTVQPDGTQEIKYYYLDHDYNKMRLKAKVECATDDQGGQVRYEFKQMGFILNKIVRKGSIVLSKGEEKTVTARHLEGNFEVGLRARQVPKPEAK